MTADRDMHHLQSRGASATTSFGHQQTMSFEEFTNDDQTYDVQEELPLFGETSQFQSTMPDTISPQDLALTHDDFSPDLINSQTFDNLHTPSLYDDTSPFLDSIDTSPAYENFRPNHGFAPLFPQDDEQTPEPPRKRVRHREPDVASSTPDVASSTPDVASSTDSFVRPTAPAMSRNTSSRSEHTDNAADRELMRQRLSMTGEIPKSTRRASRVLNPIEVDSGDENAAKRAKNTLAARKSRQKKRDEVATLETKLLEQMEETNYWKMLAISLGAPVPSPSANAMTPN